MQIVRDADVLFSDTSALWVVINQMGFYDSQLGQFLICLILFFIIMRVLSRNVNDLLQQRNIIMVRNILTTTVGTDLVFSCMVPSAVIADVVSDAGPEPMFIPPYASNR